MIFYPNMKSIKLNFHLFTKFLVSYICEGPLKTEEQISSLIKFFEMVNCMKFFTRVNRKDYNIIKSLLVLAMCVWHA